MSSMFGPASPAPPRTATPAPISAGERIMSIDVLRGVALCGILIMNIPWFARAESTFFNPLEGGGFEGADYWTWLISHLFFDAKMMTIFSMLFGAGMLVLTERAAATGRSAAAIYYRRLAWLLLFGLLHAYLLWYGDILYTYALCGLLLYPMRKLRPRTLIIVGVVLLVIGNAINMSSGMFFAGARDAWVEVQQAPEDATIDPMTQGFADAWEDIRQDFDPSAEALAEEEAAHLGRYWDLFWFRAEQAIFMQTGLFFMFMLWRALGCMLLGMALMKLNVFTAARALGFYAVLMLVGYAIGVPIVLVGAMQTEAHEFDIVYQFKFGWTYNWWGSIVVALGHIGLVMLVCKLGVLKWVTTGLSAIGRMALTNYLSHSLILAIVFYGWGFGMWGQWSRFETMGVVAAIWVFQFIVSQVWLSMFRFGPMEWLWRTLTYWRWQPMRRTPSEAVAA